MATPYIPNAFLFIDSRLYWHGEPELENDTPDGFIAAVEAAVGVAGGVSPPPEWFVKVVTEDEEKERIKRETSRAATSREQEEMDEEDEDDEDREPASSTPSTSIQNSSPPSSIETNNLVSAIEKATAGLSLGEGEKSASS